MTENEKFIYESISSQVRMGFLSKEEIMDIIIEVIEDNEFENEISEKWANKKIKEEFEKLKEESKSWKHPTDTDRLIEAFKELCKSNIIALHNAGYTTSDGEAEIVEVETELMDKGIRSDGYCFYHEQDLESALDPDSSSLWIAFQKVDNSNETVTLEVGRKVVEVLKKHQFEINWEEAAGTKIKIVNFNWQKVFKESDDDLLDYTKVVEMMTA